MQGWSEAGGGSALLLHARALGSALRPPRRETQPPSCGGPCCAPPGACSLPAALSSSWTKPSASAGIGDAAAAYRRFPRPCTPSLALSLPCCVPLRLPRDCRKPQPVPVAGGSGGSVAWRSGRPGVGAVVSAPRPRASVSLPGKGEGGHTPAPEGWKGELRRQAGAAG